MEAVGSPPARGPGIPRAFHAWYMPIWVVLVTHEWWLVYRDQLAGSLPSQAPHVSLILAATLAALARLAANAVEAAFYSWWWRLRGATISFVRLFEWMFSLSALDLLAARLLRLADAHPGWTAHGLAVVAGIGALRGEHPGVSAGLWAAFGSLGLLCLARIVATAHIQRLGIGGGLAAPLRLTLGVWLLTRFAIWWLVDLARGMSPLS